MFKLKYKRYKTQQGSPKFSEEYPGPIDPDDADGYNHYPGEYYQDAPHLQGYECLICNSPITGAHLLVITKCNEFYIHPSCILSGFALVLNGLGLLVKLLFTRKHREP